MRLKVKNEKSLERDMESRAIINTDDAGYHKYMARKRSMEEKNAEIADLKNEVRELRDLVQSLLENINK